MKQAKFMMMAAAVAGAALFSGCRKDAALLNNTLVNNTAVATAPTGPNAKGENASVSYFVDVLPQDPGLPISWQKGSLGVVDLILEAAVQNASGGTDPVMLVKTLPQQVSLFPSAAVGAIDPMAGLYKYFNFRVRLAAKAGHSLELQGLYNMDGVGVRVHLIVDDEILLGARLEGPVKLAANTLHAARLQWKLSSLTRSIPEEMLRNAKRDPMDPKEKMGSITISATSNMDLYPLFIHALREQTLGVQFK